MLPCPQTRAAWVEQQVGARVVGVRRLPGASSAAVHALRCDDGTTFVLRRYVWPGFLIDEPLAPRREVDALVYAHRNGIRVPEVVAHDLTGAEQGAGVPAVLMSFLPGVARAVPDLDRLAEAAAAIHAVDGVGFDHEYAPWYEDTMTAPPVASERPGTLGVGDHCVARRDARVRPVVRAPRLPSRQRAVDSGQAERRRRLGGRVPWAARVRPRALLRQSREPRRPRRRPTRSSARTSHSPVWRSTRTGRSRRSSSTVPPASPRRSCPSTSRASTARCSPHWADVEAHGHPVNDR